MVINLLPWREYQREYETSIIKKIIISLFISHGLMILSGYFLLAVINHEYKTRILHLTAQIKKANVEQNNTSIYRQPSKSNTSRANDFLLPHSLALIKVFQSLQKNNSNELCLTMVKRHKNNWIMMGKTRTLPAFMAYLKQLNAASLFSSINIADLNQKQNEWQFRLLLLEKY